jgi:hypothetical protein
MTNYFLILILNEGLDVSMRFLREVPGGAKRAKHRAKRSP